MKKRMIVVLFVASTFFANAQNISTIAGTGVRGYSGDGGPATNAKITQPGDVAVSNGNVIFSDPANFKIRKIKSGIIQTIAGNGTSLPSGDGGPATAAGLTSCWVLAVDQTGSIYLASQDVVRKIDTVGIITTIAGSTSAILLGDGGPATGASLNTVNGIYPDGFGNIYISDCGHHRIRKVEPSGTITTVAGTGVAGSFGDGGPATDAQLNSPCGLCCDKEGNVYVADVLDLKIRKISTSGIITTFAGTGTFGTAGNGGPATNAEFESPQYLAYNARNGDICVCDRGIAQIRAIHPSGIITALVGTSVRGYGGDGGPAIDAEISVSRGITYDQSGDFYICDVENDRVRKVTHDPTVVPQPLEGEEEGIQIVYDLRGVIVSKRVVENKNHSVDERLPIGVYIYTFVSTKSRKVLIQKQITIMK